MSSFIVPELRIAQIAATTITSFCTAGEGKKERERGRERERERKKMREKKKRSTGSNLPINIY